jgi:hypothetical protein
MPNPGGRVNPRLFVLVGLARVSRGARAVHDAFIVVPCSFSTNLLITTPLEVIKLAGLHIFGIRLTDATYITLLMYSIAQMFIAPTVR